MTAAVLAPSRMLQPVFLTGLVVFGFGLATQAALLCYLGLTVFLGAHMIKARSGELPSRHRAIPSRHPASKPSGRCQKGGQVRPRRVAPAAQAPICNTFRLRPIVPLRDGTEAHGWFGGCPSLPDDMDWPECDGQPALFLAQIDCAHLPDCLWAGRGPRSGWLVIFRASGPDGASIILHTETPGEPRDPPAPWPTASLPPMREDILARATGTAAAPPRWPIRICAPDHMPGGKTPRRSDAEHPGGGWVDPTALPLSDPRLHPFDWGSAMILIEVALSSLAWQARVVSALDHPHDTDDPCVGAFLTSLAAARANVTALKVELCKARSKGLPFRSELRDLLIEGLQRLRIDSGLSAGSEDTDPALQPLLESDLLRGDYIRWLDHHARMIYVAAPARLPRPQRALFEAQWARRARRESGWIGGIAPDVPDRPEASSQETPVPVLRFQDSALIGWTFGAGGDFEIEISPDALARGDFSAARRSAAT